MTTEPRWLLISTREDCPITFLDDGEHARLIANPRDESGVTRWLDAVPAERDPNYWPDGDGLLLRVELVVPPAPKPPATLEPHPGESRHQFVERVVTEQGPLRLMALADLVAPATRTGTDETVATVWDLVQAGRLDYDADAMVRAVTPTSPEPEQEKTP